MQLVPGPGTTGSIFPFSLGIWLSNPGIFFRADEPNSLSSKSRWDEFHDHYQEKHDGCARSDYCPEPLPPLPFSSNRCGCCPRVREHDADLVGRAKRKKPRKKIQGKKFEEQNVTRFEGKNGKFSYRVQIRKRVDGKQHSLTKTFKHLPNAKNGEITNSATSS
jgi:hypothetical protein